MGGLGTSTDRERLPQHTEESNVAKQFGEFLLLNTYCTYIYTYYISLSDCHGV